MTQYSLDDIRPDWSVVLAENRGLSIDTVSFLGEGWTSRVFLVNQELAFSFPKRPEYWRDIERESVFLTAVADDLPLQVPRYERLVPDSSAATHGYAIRRYVAGEAFNPSRLSALQREDAAERIAMFLKTLHGLKLPAAVFSSLRWRNERQIAERCLAATEREILPTLPLGDGQVISRRLERYLATPENFSRAYTTIHGDFQLAHIMVTGGRVSGVIDFCGVAWGDPDYDFKDLHQECESAFVETIARRYGHPDPPRLFDKLDYFDLWNILDIMLRSPDETPAGAKERAKTWLDRYLSTH